MEFLFSQFQSQQTLSLSLNKNSFISHHSNNDQNRTGKKRHNKKRPAKKHDIKCQGPDTNLIVVIFNYSFFLISSEFQCIDTGKRTIILNRDSGVKDHLI